MNPNISIHRDVRVAWLIALLAILIAVCVWQGADRPVSSAPIALPASAKPQHTLNESDRFAGISFATLAASRQTRYEVGGRNIFILEQKLPVESRVHGSDDAQKAAPASNLPPHLPPPQTTLKFYGFAKRNEEFQRIFLVDEGKIFIAKVGEIVESRYRLIRIAKEKVLLEDLRDSGQLTIPLTLE